MCGTRLKAKLEAKFANNRFSKAFSALAPLTFTRQNIGPLFWTGLGTVTSAVGSVLIPVLWGQALADLQDESNSHVLGLRAGAIVAAGAYATSYCVSSFASSIQNIGFAPIGPRAAGKLVARYLKVFLAQSREEYENLKQGKASNLAFKPYMTVTPILNATFNQIAPALINTGIAATFVAKWNGPTYGFIVAGTVVAMGIFSSFMVSPLVKRRDYQLKTGIQAGEGISFFLTRFPTIQIFGAEEAELNKVKIYIENDADANTRINEFIAKTNLGQNIIACSGYVIAVMLGAQGVHSGKLTINQLIVLSSYVGSLIGPVTNLAGGLQELISAVAGLKDVINAINTPSQLVDAHPDVEFKLSPGEATLELRDVRFRYQPKPDDKKPQEEVLHGISLRIPAGKKVGLVGATGSGKSTLITLIPRLYEATDGEILIGNVNIKDVGVKHLRAAIANIPQETALIDGTLRENIAYGLIDTTDAQIIEAATGAGLLSLIEKHGLDATVGEGGIRLSGGEKQRVAIARALLRKPLLVLGDEVTSALDARTSEQIIAAIDAAFANTTRIFVAHRLETLVDADMIVVLKAGQIVEQGTHAELLALEGVYAELWRKANEKFYGSDNHGMTLFRPVSQSSGVDSDIKPEESVPLQKIVIV